ncbi:hypothetical protein [Streptomyces sp. NPDC002209]|uniref:hypothetical protein n=1 Tax=Streptomyces sp. NPDC002209 TaxID=3364638 RepID=UPI00369054C1
MDDHPGGPFGRRGGPDALRYFYRGQGVLIGAALTVANIAGTVTYEKWRAAEPAPQATETPPPSESTLQH